MIDDKHIRPSLSFLSLWTNVWLGLWRDCLDCASRLLWIWQGVGKPEDWSEEKKNAIPIKWDSEKGVWIDNPTDSDASAKFVDKLRDEWDGREGEEK